MELLIGFHDIIRVVQQWLSDTGDAENLVVVHLLRSTLVYSISPSLVLEAFRIPGELLESFNLHWNPKEDWFFCQQRNEVATRQLNLIFSVSRQKAGSFFLVLLSGLPPEGAAHV